MRPTIIELLNMAKEPQSETLYKDQAYRPYVAQAALEGYFKIDNGIISLTEKGLNKANHQKFPVIIKYKLTQDYLTVLAISATTAVVLDAEKNSGFEQGRLITMGFDFSESRYWNVLEEFRIYPSVLAFPALFVNSDAEESGRRVIMFAADVNSGCVLHDTHDLCEVGTYLVKVENFADSDKWVRMNNPYVLNLEQS